MSCRWLCQAVPEPRPLEPDPGPPSDATAVYLDLARARREDDFRWFARSQGVLPEKIDRLWHGMLQRVREGEAADDAPARRRPR